MWKPVAGSKGLTTWMVEAIERGSDKLNLSLGQPEVCEPAVVRPDIPGAHAAGYGPGLAP